MHTTTILNIVLALGVIVMVVAPLVWAILTQHRDRPQLAVTDAATARTPHPQPRTRSRQPSYEPVGGRA